MLGERRALVGCVEIQRIDVEAVGPRGHQVHFDDVIGKVLGEAAHAVAPVSAREDDFVRPGFNCYIVGGCCCGWEEGWEDQEGQYRRLKGKQAHLFFLWLLVFFSCWFYRLWWLLGPWRWFGFRRRLGLFHGNGLALGGLGNDFEALPFGRLIAFP